MTAFSLSCTFCQGAQQVDDNSANGVRAAAAAGQPLAKVDCPECRGQGHIRFTADELREIQDDLDIGRLHGFERITLPRTTVEFLLRHTAAQLEIELQPAEEAP